LQESSDGYGWWQTPTMGKPLKWFAFFANLFILTVEILIPTVPTLETVVYVVHQPHLYGTVFPLVECLSPTNRNPGQWIFYPMFGISSSQYISCENLQMGMVGGKHQPWVNR